MRAYMQHGGIVDNGDKPSPDPTTSPQPSQSPQPDQQNTPNSASSVKLVLVLNQFYFDLSDYNLAPGPDHTMIFEPKVRTESASAALTFTDINQPCQDSQGAQPVATNSQGVALSRCNSDYWVFSSAANGGAPHTVFLKANQKDEAIVYRLLSKAVPAN